MCVFVLPLITIVTRIILLYKHIHILIKHNTLILTLNESIPFSLQT